MECAGTITLHFQNGDRMVCVVSQLHSQRYFVTNTPKDETMAILSSQVSSQVRASGQQCTAGSGARLVQCYLPPE